MTMLTQCSCRISGKSCSTRVWLLAACALFATLPAAAETSTRLDSSFSSAAASSAAAVDSDSAQCRVHVVANDVIVSDREREEVGFHVLPAGIIPEPGQWPYFAWSDTSLGVVRPLEGTGYLFFGSDGGCHENCNDQKTWRWGSITVSHGTMDHPLGTPLGDPNPQVYEFAFPRARTGLLTSVMPEAVPFTACLTESRAPAVY